MKGRAILIAFVAVLLVACTHGAAPLRAVYLVQGQGQLDPAELAAHPEVAVVHTWADFQRLAQTKVALWIDKDAVDLVDRQWLNEAPQRSYPLAIVGYSSALYAFREALRPLASLARMSIGARRLWGQALACGCCATRRAPRMRPI